MIRIEEHNSLDALAAHRPMWNECHARTPHASFFQSFEWLAAHWRHVGGSRRLRVLLMWSDEQPWGVLVTNVVIEKTQVGSMRTLAFPLDGWGSFYGPLGANPAAVLREGLCYFQNHRHDFDFIDLRGLPSADISTAGISRAETPASSLQWPNAQGEFSQVALIDLDQDWDTYWASRKKEPNRRRNVERCERRLAELGEVTYIRYRPAGAAERENDPRWDLYDACESLAAKSWQAGLRDGNTLSHAEVRDFVRDAHTAAIDAGAVDLNLLFLDNRPIAFVYAYHYRGYIDLMRIGFDPDLAKVAPGNALWTRLIQDSMRRGDRVLDLGPTCLDYKKFWMTRMEPSLRAVAFPWTPRAQGLRLARWLRTKMPPPAEETNQRAKEDATKPSANRVGKSETVTSDNPCAQCSIHQDCCAHLAGLRVTQAEFDRCFANLANELHIEHEGPILVLTPKRGAPCPNWQNGGCAVYDVRPRECRLFPFTLFVRRADANKVSLAYHSDTRCPLKQQLLPDDASAHRLVADFGREAFDQLVQIEVARETPPERIQRRGKEIVHSLIRSLKSIVRGAAK